MNDEPDQLESVLHEKLRALAEIQAPADLVPQVLRRLDAPDARPWWRRPWMEWPGFAQVISAAFLSALAGGACYWRESVLAVVRDWSRHIPGVSAFWHETCLIAQTFGDVFGHFLAAARFPWLAGAAAVVISAYLGVIGVGAIFCQVLSREPGNPK